MPVLKRFLLPCRWRLCISGITNFAHICAGIADACWCFLPSIHSLFILLTVCLSVAQVKDYDAVLDLELDSMDKFVLQCLAFYQVLLMVAKISLIRKFVIHHPLTIRYCWFSIPFLYIRLHDIYLFLLQKEIALYTASKVNSEFCWFDIDGDIDPLFKVKFDMIDYISALPTQYYLLATDPFQGD